MSSLTELFHASPEECFEEIARTLAALSQASQRTGQDVQRIAELVDKIVLGRLSSHITTPARRWVYEVGLPNKYFQDVYDVEIGLNGPKRWVGKSGKLAGELVLPRSLQYAFEVTVVDFATPETRASFSLAIDGTLYPWLNTTDSVFRTIVQEAQGVDTLGFELAIDQATCLQADLTFSFSSIRVEAL